MLVEAPGLAVELDELGDKTEDDELEDTMEDDDEEDETVEIVRVGWKPVNPNTIATRRAIMARTSAA
jgi:hypothetical protein